MAAPFPCQDTPSVKAPFALSVTVPVPLVVAASGNPVGARLLFSGRSTSGVAGWMGLGLKVPKTLEFLSGQKECLGARVLGGQAGGA